MIRLFIREHTISLLFPVFISLLCSLIFVLDGFRSVNTVIYVVVLSTILTVVIHFYLYLRKYKYYKRILTPPKAMEDLLEKMYPSPEQQQEHLYLQQLYKVYQQEVQRLYAAQKRHLQFMNGWVHQMKTPIAVIDLMVQQDEKLDSQSVSEEIERIKRALEAVLMNARLDTFEEDLRIEKVNLKELVSTIVNENKRLFIKRQVFPVVEVDPSLVVSTDRKWIQFIVSQFITNAVKYSFTPQSKIWITSDCSESGCTLSVRDEGIGIPKSDIKRVTRAFFTGENGRKTGESTGMGLYIAQEVSQKLGHTLAIESEVGRGTTVSLSFIEFEKVGE